MQKKKKEFNKYILYKLHYTLLKRSMKSDLMHMYYVQTIIIRHRNVVSCTIINITCYTVNVFNQNSRSSSLNPDLDNNDGFTVLNVGSILKLHEIVVFIRPRGYKTTGSLLISVNKFCLLNYGYKTPIFTRVVMHFCRRYNCRASKL